MDTFYVAVALCLVAGVSTTPDPEPSKIFYDRGIGIEDLDPATDTSVTRVNVNSTFRSLCSIGSTLYYTEDGDVYENGTLFLEGDGDIHAIACCCNFIATAYTDSDDDTYVSVRKVDDDAITITKTFEGQGNVALEFFKKDSETYLLVVSETSLYLYDADALDEGPVFMNNSLTLTETPRCVASYCGNDDVIYSFVSFDSRSGMRLDYNYTIGTGIVNLEDSPVGFAEIFGFAIPGSISCVDIEDEYIYFVVGDDTGHEVASYPIGHFVPAIPIPPSRMNVNQLVSSMTVGIPIGSRANGLSVCGSSCNTPCDAECGCQDSPSCGLCYSGGNGKCQCKNSAHVRCIYSDPTQAAACIVREPRINACCMVKNPVALRRSGEPISVVGVTSIDGEITVDRLARTGRWRKLPINSPISVKAEGITIQGFSAPVQSTARGRRFGAYYAEFVPNSSGQREWIPCVATENSGFLNTKFTVTVSHNQAATLQATFASGLVRFMSSLRWYYSVGKDYETSPTPISSCNGNLICNLPAPVQEGVYEVFRQPRYLRTWHPIFYVFVRACNDGWYGPGCVSPCPNCVNGICDDVTGLCNCAPGFNGTLCDNPCELGYVGSGCDIACGNVFNGHDDCAEILICNPGRIGCRCYPGLQAPYCMNPCEEGYWGPDCMNECATDGCDPRTGTAG